MSRWPKGKGSWHLPPCLSVCNLHQEFAMIMSVYFLMLSNWPFHCHFCLHPLSSVSCMLVFHRLSYIMTRLNHISFYSRKREAVSLGILFQMPGFVFLSLLKVSIRDLKKLHLVEKPMMLFHVLLLRLAILAGVLGICMQISTVKMPSSDRVTLQYLMLNTSNSSLFVVMLTSQFHYR